MSSKRTRAKSTTTIERALRYRGILTRVANQLGVKRQHVSAVARGQRQSSRVLVALLAEIERIKKAA